MTDEPKKATADAVRLALQLKQGRTASGRPDAGRISEREAHARSVSKSKPALRK